MEPIFSIRYKKNNKIIQLFEFGKNKKDVYCKIWDEFKPDAILTIYRCK